MVEAINELAHAVSKSSLFCFKNILLTVIIHGGDAAGAPTVKWNEDHGFTLYKSGIYLSGNEIIAQAIRRELHR
ncbi:hypothetical protein KCP76_18090 [Salmonella enterica subsp. enterica serovar Weltevreden]|nr:hypothetical protein KCP76_18090 [Salmonella enterica subsp. enterica serovar Weltevreden]